MTVGAQGVTPLVIEVTTRSSSRKSVAAGTKPISAMKPDSLIHLRVPAATKGRWVRASRAAGMRLSDWITQAVEAQMQHQITKIAIPNDLEFSELNLSRGSDGNVSFDWSVIEKICIASNVSPDLFKDGPEDNVASLIINWYAEHRKEGGAADTVAEDLFSEVLAEDKAGQSFSYQPGNA